MTADCIEQLFRHAAAVANGFERMPPSMSGLQFGIIDAKAPDPCGDALARFHGARLAGIGRIVRCRRLLQLIVEQRPLAAPLHELDEPLLDQMVMQRHSPRVSGFGRSSLRCDLEGDISKLLRNKAPDS